MTTLSNYNVKTQTEADAFPTLSALIETAIAG